jgi:hypothetical protein
VQGAGAGRTGRAGAGTGIAATVPAGAARPLTAVTEPGGAG